ncbi:MAG TPA: dihydropteroate synthase [Chthonomonadales bacterium]|nr:dihydropteroate synthase [Chthonomonadales bacterium]
MHNGRAASALRALLSKEARGKRTLVMGILNVTPDSFSDGGRYSDTETAVLHGLRMAEEGADIIDVGGESTRPATFAAGTGLSAEAELNRVEPVVRRLAKRLPGMPISIDTYKASVADGAMRAGACMVNDISALRADPDMARVVARYGAPVCLMHLPGLPMAISGMAEPLSEVMPAIKAHLEQRVEDAKRAGIEDVQIVLDPGVGFGKNVLQNLEIMRSLKDLTVIGYPLLVGASRKSTIGHVLGGLSAEERLEGTAATVAISIAHGASIVRVHDVKAMVRVARMTDAIVRGWPPESEV